MSPTKQTHQRGNQHGAVLVIVAISMIALLGVVALAVDYGYLAVTKTELQNIADASALAGAGELAKKILQTEKPKELSIDWTEIDSPENAYRAAQSIVKYGI